MKNANRSSGKNRKTKYALALAAVLGAATFGAVFAPAPAQAGVLYWSGTHTWDNSTTQDWGITSGGPYTTNKWANNDDAIFEGTAGTVTVSGNITNINSITFTTDGYTLSGTGTLLSRVPAEASATGAGADTISSIIAGSVGLTMNGTGTLNLTAVNSYAGGTTINNGTLDLSGANGKAFYLVIPHRGPSMPAQC